MQKVFMGVMAGAVNDKVLTVVRMLVDFIYYSQFQSHTTTSLSVLQASLELFHKHKDIFVELEIREHFNIPKLHAIQHYIDAIKQLGSLDGYNSESPERLHIDFAKEAYRASNRRDFLEQMAIWLQRREAINIRCSFIQWLHGRLPSLLEHPPESLAADAAASAEDEQTPSNAYSSTLHTVSSYRIAKTAPFRCTVSELETLHGATNFLLALTVYLEQVNPKSRVVPLSYDRFDTYKKITIDLVANCFLSSETRTSQIRATTLVVEDLGSYKAKGGIIGVLPGSLSHPVLPNLADYQTRFEWLKYAPFSCFLCSLAHIQRH